MARADRLKKAIEQTAAKARDKQESESGPVLTQNPLSKNYVAQHRHCNICHAPVHMDKDPPLCGSEKCGAEWGKKETARKRLTIMLYLFPGIAIMLVLLQGFNK